MGGNHDKTMQIKGEGPGFHETPRADMSATNSIHATGCPPQTAAVRTTRQCLREKSKERDGQRIPVGTVALTMDGGVERGDVAPHDAKGTVSGAVRGKGVQKIKSCKPEDRSAQSSLNHVHTRFVPPQHKMADVELPAWVYKPASEASEAEQKAFVALSQDDTNLPVIKAALERDPSWALVSVGDVS